MKEIVYAVCLVCPMVLIASGLSADEMALYRARRYGAEAKECLRVIDQDGVPVADARVWGGLHHLRRKSPGLGSLRPPIG